MPLLSNEKVEIMELIRAFRGADGSADVDGEWLLSRKDSKGWTPTDWLKVLQPPKKGGEE